MYIKTYSDCNYDNLWKSLFMAGNLFRTVAGNVAEYYGFHYPYGDDERVTTHLRHIKELSKSAKEMY